MSQTEDTTPPSIVSAEPAPHDHERRRRRSLGNPLAWLTAVIAILVLVVVAVAGVALGRAQRTTSQGSITVSGSGTIQGTPNTVSFNVGVHTVKPTAQQALYFNNLRIKGLEATLMRYQVKRKDLQTSDVNIYEMTDQDGNVTGFSVDDSLSVTFPYSNKAGSVIDAAAAATGNGITFGGISLSISNESTYLAAARGRAMHNAETVADQDARGGDTSLGRILRVTDEENSSPVRTYAFAAALDSTEAGVPIEAGRQPVSVQVTVVYALDD